MKRHEEFDQALEAAKRRYPKLFDLQSEAPLTSNELEAVERTLGVPLPPQFRWFLETHGAGQFGLTVIYSIRRNARCIDSVLDAMDQPWLAEHAGFLPFADNGCGDYYGFRTSDGAPTADAVYFFNHEDDTVQDDPVFRDFFQFVLANAVPGG